MSVTASTADISKQIFVLEERLVEEVYELLSTARLNKDQMQQYAARLSTGL